jgi:hypothetical protein
LRPRFFPVPARAIAVEGWIVMVSTTGTLQWPESPYTIQIAFAPRLTSPSADLPDVQLQAKPVVHVWRGCPALPPSPERGLFFSEHTTNCKHYLPLSSSSSDLLHQREIVQTSSRSNLHHRIDFTVASRGRSTCQSS